MKMKCEICGEEKDSKILGRHVRNSHRISALEYAIKYLRHPKKPPLCACGCGERITIWNGINSGYNKYIKGHDVRTRTQESRNKISETLKRKYKNSEIEPWNKGLTKETDERMKKISENLEGNLVPEEIKIKISETVKNIHKNGTVYGESWKEKIRESSLGRKHTDESKRKLSLSKMGENNPMYGIVQSKETRHKRSLSLKKAHSDGKFDGRSCFKNMGLHKSPSRFEIAVGQKLKPLGYEFNLPIRINERKTGMSYYHIDFAHKKLLIAIELDSELHNSEKSKKSDYRKDNYLKSIGWDIHRIKFSSKVDPEKLAKDVYERAKELKNEKSSKYKKSRDEKEKTRGLIY